MAKKAARRKAVAKTRRTSARKAGEDYYIVVHSWIFVVAFALMLGMGAVVGTFINSQLNSTAPQVAGYQIEAR